MRTGKIGFAVIALVLALALSGAVPQGAELLYKSGLYEEEVGGNLPKAIAIYQDIVKRFPDNGAIAAQAQLRIGFCYEKLGMQEAQKAFESVIKNYPGQVEAVKIAKEKLAGLVRAPSTGETDARSATVRHILGWNDLSINGSVSPDERYISLTDWDTGDLAVRDISTGKQRRLTNKGAWDDAHPGYAMESIWSPDSRRVAYSWVNANNESELHEVGLADPKPRIIRGEENGIWTKPIEWTPDGKSILAKASSQNGPTELRLISVADGSIRLLKTFSERNLPPGNAFISPDGRSVAYASPSPSDPRTLDIFLLTPADGREIPLVQHPAHDNLLGWLPNGRGILFASDRTGSIDAWILPLEAGKPQGPPAMVKRSIGTIHPITMTRNGKFYFATPGALRDIYTAALDLQTGRPVDGAIKVPLTYEGNNLQPAWSPDGKILAYVSWRELAKRDSVLCLYSIETKELREIQVKKIISHPRWAPDGRHLFVQAASMDGGGIYQIDLGSEEMAVFLKAEPGKSFHSVQVTPDRKMVVYGQENDKEKTYRILVRDVQSGRDRELERTSFTNNTTELSPDGKHLAMLLRTEERLRILKVMDFPEGSPKEILRFPLNGSFIIALAWSPDSRFIYFSQNPDDDLNWDLWRVPREGGEGQNLGFSMRRFESLCVHPDGRRIAFASNPPDGEFPQVWVMENFLPISTGKK